MVQSESVNSSPRPRRRWLRRLIGLALVLGALLLGAYLVFTSSWYVLRQAQPALSRALGGEVTAEHASLDPSGRITFEGVTLRAPGVDGEAGKVLTVGRLVVTLDRRELWRGTIVPTAITLHEAVVRLSEREDQPGAFNFESLAPEPGDGDSEPPRVTLASATLEVGSHRDGRYEARGRLPIVGELYASPGERELFLVTLAEAATSGGGAAKDGLRLEGQFKPETFEYQGRLTGAAFTDRLYNLLPTMGRRWWERLDLKGRIANVRLEVNRDHELWSEIEVEEVAMTIPIETDGIWARYSDGQVSPSRGLPRMRVESGSIRLEGDELVLDNLMGELSSTADTPGLAYRVVGRIGSLPSFAWNDREAWMRTVVEHAPLDVTFRLEDFRFSQESDDQSALELPLAVARVLERLTVRTAVLDTEIKLHRERPATLDGDVGASPLTSTGRVVIRDGAGAFDKFPYPLRDVQGVVRFTMDELLIESIVGKGSGDSTVTLVGRVAPLVREAAVDLTIEAKNVPMDEAMLSAFEPGTRSAFESLFDQDAARRLRDAGLLTAREGAETGFPLGSFTPGGLMNLSLAVNRPFGSGKRTITSGQVNVIQADFIYRGFPYPFRVHRGRLELAADDIQVIDFEATTAGGGHGVVSGSIGITMENGSARVDPNLEIIVGNDRVNPLLLAAIPLTREEQAAMDDVDGWPGRIRSRAAQFIDAISLEGTLSYTGEVRNTDERVMHYDFAVQLKDGVAGRSTERAREMGVPWPEGFVLENMTGLMHVAPGRIRLAELVGERGMGTMSADGEIITENGDGTITFKAGFKSMAVEPYLINVFAEEDRPDWQAWWEAYQPDGQFDLELNYASSLGARSMPELKVQPRGLSILIGDERLELTSTDGAIEIRENGLLFGGCALAVGPDGRDGEVIVNGRAALDGTISTTAQWSDARFEASWLANLIERYAGERAMMWYRALGPMGFFDATLSYDTIDEERLHPLLVEIQPRTLSVERGGERIHATMTGDGRLSIDPGGIWVHDVRGITDDALAFGVDGTIGQVGEELRAELTIDAEAPGAVRSLLVLVPDDVRRALEGIDFSASGGISVDEAMFRLRQRANGSSDLIFRGDIALRGGALDTGLRFTEIDGSVLVDAERQGERRPQIALHFDVDRAVVDRRVLRNLQADLVLSDSGERWLLPNLNASLYGGSVVAQAQFGVGSNTSYSVHVDLVGVGMAPFTQPEKAGNGGANGRGRLFGSLGLRGKRDDPASREGRGGMRVLGGEMANAPITMSLVQLSQLMLPLHSALEFADASFFVRGDTVIIERLMLESPTLILQGEGTMGFSSGELNIRLRPRGKLGPISDVLGAINDQLFAIEVRGTLSEPRSSIIAIPGVGGLFEPSDRASAAAKGDR